MSEQLINIVIHQKKQPILWKLSLSNASSGRIMNNIIIQQNQSSSMISTRMKYRWLQNHRINLLK